MIEEVPPTPEAETINPRYRSSHVPSMRLTLVQPSTSKTGEDRREKQAVQRPAEHKRKSLSAFYFEENDEGINRITADPFASAVSLEKANCVPVSGSASQREFRGFSNTQNGFRSVCELARHPDPDQPAVATKPNYSFTQMEIDTELMWLFEEVDDKAKDRVEESGEPENPKPPREPLSEQTSAVEDVSSVHENDTNYSNDTLGCILSDFCSETSEPQINFSLISTEGLRRRLLQLQDHINSPPKAVRKETGVCRDYGRLKAKPAIVRRLSYETDESSCSVQQSLRDDESSEPSSPPQFISEDEAEISLDADTLNHSSVHIQANLTQLSTFFSKAIPSQSSGAEATPQPIKPKCESFDRESPFYGFTPDPLSSISLAPDTVCSPQTIQMQFGTFDSSSEEEIEPEDLLASGDAIPGNAAKDSIAMEQLLEHDDELFMLAHPVDQKSTPNKDLVEQNNIKELRASEMYHDRQEIPCMNVCFNTARGSSIAVSNAAMFKAKALFADEETKQQSETDQRVVSSEGHKTANKLVSNQQAVNQAPGALTGVTGIAGFSTASGSSISISKQALERAKALFAEEEKEDQNAMETHSSDSRRAESREITAPSGQGFSTAGGNKISVSKEALQRVQLMANEESSTNNNIDVPFKAGFATARGGAIAVSKQALDKARVLFADEECESTVDTGTSMANAAMLCGAGFSTAKGDKISVSSEALARAKLLFPEEDNGMDKDNASNTNAPHHTILAEPAVPALPSFNRANGTSITISSNAIEKAKQLWSKFERENEPPSVVALSNATGKQISHSDIPQPRVRVLGERKMQATSPGPGVRKRKVSFDQETDPRTPTKKSRISNPMVQMQTSTPAATAISSSKLDPVVAVAGHDVDAFFAALDDSEFHELFNNPETVTKPSAIEPRELPGIKQQNTSTSHWDDSFPELLPKLATIEELPEPVRVENPSEAIRQGRLAELQKQQEFVRNKPENLCHPRVPSIFTRKQQKNRVSLEHAVGYKRPTVPSSSVLEPSKSVTMENVMDFRFNMIEFYGDTVCNSNVTGVPVGGESEGGCLILDEHSTVGLEQLKAAFLAAPGIDPRLIPPGWVENAWRWIVTKLSAMERCFGEQFTGVLSPENVFQQLQYRYHREIDLSQRPPVRKMLEKDDVASRRMVLFVSNIHSVDGPIEWELELSDGWYAVRTTIDAALESAVSRGKIAIGTKLMVQGAELLNHKDGCAALDVPNDVRLKIHANSTRRVRWMVRLGYYHCPEPFLIPCNSILDRGGLIRRFRCTIVRVYPLMFVEKSDTKSMLRSERMQQRHNKRNDAGKLDRLHKLYNQIQNEIETERAARSLNRNIRITEATSCEELQEMLENGLDLSCLEIDLSHSQKAIIERFHQEQQEALQNEINRRVKAQLDKHPTDRGSIVELLKVRLMDRTTPTKVFLLSIWRPSEEVRSLLEENCLFELQNVSAKGTKSNEMQLTAHKSTTYAKLGREDGNTPASLQPFLRSVMPIGDIDGSTFRPAFSEFDTVGVVVYVGTAEKKKFQSIYLADTAMDLLCVNFWYGLAEYAYDDLITERKLLCVANLQWRTISRQSTVPHSFATEYTTFTENPRQPHLRVAWDRFQVQLNAIDQEQFFRRCYERVRELNDNSFLSGSGTVTPNSSVGRSVSTPLLQRSAASRMQQHSTPLGASSSLTKRKLETLSTFYASPPKMSPIVIRTNPILRKGFRTPARLEDRLEQRSKNEEDGR